MYDDSCTLNAKTVTVSDAGDPKETTSIATTVFCQVSSASYRDKEAAESRGKNADLSIRLADRFDYSGQRFLTYNGEEYEVGDTYFDDRSRELRLVVTKWEGQ